VRISTRLRQPSSDGAADMGWRGRARDRGGGARDIVSGMLRLENCCSGARGSAGMLPTGVRA
jgi:hypothetical protein